MHSGHPAALHLPSFELPQGNVLTYNKGQKIIYEYWKAFWDKAKNCDYVLNLGDSTDGVNRKEFGHDILMTDLNLQTNMAIDLIKPYLKGRKYLSVSGSGYHGSLDTSVEDTICKAFNGHFFGQIGWWKVKGTDKTLFVAHDLGCTMYKGTALDRHRLYSDALADHLTPADLILGGHVHKYFSVSTGNKLACYLPCWKAWHPIKAFGAKGYFIHYPRLGGAIINIGSRITIEPILFEPVRIYDEVTEI